jgi:hypothetical protein
MMRSNIQKIQNKQRTHYEVINLASNLNGRVVAIEHVKVLLLRLGFQR